MGIDLNAIRAAADMVRQHCDPDDDTFADTLESVSDVMEALDMLIEAERRDAAMLAALKAHIDDMTARSARLAARVGATRNAMRSVMQAAHLRRVERPLATLSLARGSISVHITNEEDVPSQLMNTRTVVTPDKTAIRAQIEAGVTVPGAELVRGPDTLAVRAR